MEQNYSKRELDSFIDHIKSSLKRQDEVLGEIRDQTTKTNGRVSGLESKRDFFLGALSVLTGVMTVIVIPLLTWGLYRIVNIDETIDTSVKEAIIEVQIES